MVFWSLGFTILSPQAVNCAFGTLPNCSGGLIWGDRIKDQHVIIRSDNMTCCEMVNSQTSRCSLCLTLLRYLILSCLKFNIDLRCIHVPSKLNAKSDSLSRIDFQRFRRLAPDAKPYPHKLCEEIWPLSMDLLKNAKF